MHNPQWRPRPSTLGEHLRARYREEFASFDAKRKWRDIKTGAGVAIVTIALQIVFNLSTRADWDEHPVGLIICAILVPFIIVGAETAYRCWKAALKVYRERDDSFRETVLVIGLMLLTACVGILIIEYGEYKTSPHFGMEIADVHAVDKGPGKTKEGPTMDGGYSIGDTDDPRQPSTSVVFFQISLKNTGVPSRAHNWRLRAKIKGATDVVEGEPSLQNIRWADPRDNSQTYFTFSVTDLIFGRSEKPFKGTLGGAAFFVLPGISPETVKAPGTKLTVSCQDDTGKEYEVSTVVTAKSRLLKSFNSSTPPPGAPSDPQREVIVTHVDVAPYVLGQPVEVYVHLKHVSNPNAIYRAYFQMQAQRDAIGGSDLQEQPRLEEKSWDLFEQTTKEKALTNSVDINIPFQNEVVMPESVQFRSRTTQNLIDGKRSLYVTGLIVGTSGKSQTPYCVIKSPHMPGITYCEHHN